MALIVEDGSGVAGADSYVTLAEFDAYWAKYGSPATVTAATDAARESACRHGTRWLDEEYAGLWLGSVTHLTQPLRHPRIGMVDDESRTIDSNTIARQVKEAVCQAGKLHLESGGLSKTKKTGVRSETLDGVVGRSFFNASGTVEVNEFIGKLIGSLLRTPPGVLFLRRA